MTEVTTRKLWAPWLGESPWRLPLLLVALAFSGLLVSCDPCEGLVSGPCAAPISIEVRDMASGEFIPDATASGSKAHCGFGHCEVWRSNGTGEAGRYELLVSAPGYVARSLAVDVPEPEEEGCFGCGYKSVAVEVILEREL